MSFAKIIPLVFLAVMFVIGIPYTVAIMGATDEGVDLTDSDYEGQYDAVTETSITTISLVQFVPILIGVTILIIGIGYLRLRT